MLQELKEDNRVLQETKEVLEDQLEGWRARSDKIHQLEKHSLLLKARVHDMEQVRCLHTRKSANVTSALCRFRSTVDILFFYQNDHLFLLAAENHIRSYLR